MRLIDADVLLESLYWLPIGKLNYNEIRKIVNRQPKANVEVTPVKHGKWIHDINNLYKCSNCLNKETMSPRRLKHFCPHCGAKMKG